MDFDPQAFEFSAAIWSWLLICGSAAAILAAVSLFFCLVSRGGAGATAWANEIVGILQDVISISPRRVFALAQLTFREAIRRKALLVFVVFAILFMFAGWFLSASSLAPEFQVKVYVTFVLRAISWLLLPVVLLLSCWGLPEDIKQRSLHTVVTKPARRLEVVLGRMLGFATVGTIVLVVGGVDVVPGVYRTVEAQAADGKDAGILFDDSCKFGQYRDADGGLDSLIAGGTADGGHPTITLGDGPLFRTQRCGAWELVRAKTLFDAPDSAPTTVTDGMWLVGADLRPGTYRTDAEFSGEYVEGAFCGWEVDSGWTDWDAEILEVAFAGPGPGEVTLKTGQQFVSDECGTWRLLGQ